MRLPLVTAGRLLLAGWVAWSLIFAWFAAEGAIPIHIRIYAVLHLLGALAVAVAVYEVVGDRQRIATAVTAAAAVALLVAIPATETTRDEWRSAYPGDVAAVNAFLANSGGGAILTDWMWWREFTVALFASTPGGAAWNYANCPAEWPTAPPATLTNGLTDVEAGRLTNAWKFLASEDARFIVMLDDAEYRKWLVWEAEDNAQLLSSFVRPLLTRDGGCYATMAGLPAATFCPVFDHGRYIVLERVQSRCIRWMRSATAGADMPTRRARADMDTRGSACSSVSSRRLTASSGSSAMTESLSRAFASISKARSEKNFEMQDQRAAAVESSISSMCSILNGMSMSTASRLRLRLFSSGVEVGDR